MDFSKRQFYAWVDQANREAGRDRADDPNSWAGEENDPFWVEARARRDKLQGR